MIKESSKLYLTSQQECNWRQQGFCIVDDFDVEEARTEAIFEEESEFGDFGSKAGAYEFPTGLMSLDFLAIRLQPAIQQLLRCSGAYISQADFWVKKPKEKSIQSNDDQRFHCDFGNNIIIPTLWNEPTAVSVIIYLDGEENCKGGATSVVPRLGSHDDAYMREKMVIQPGYGDRPFINNRIDAEKWFTKNKPDEGTFRQTLYERAVSVLPKIGRILIYRLDLWHRGTPVLEGSRRAMNIVWFSKNAKGTCGRWNSGFWKQSYWWNPRKIYAAPEKLFEKLTPEERVAIGIPPLSDKQFWTRENLHLIKLRFPQFNIQPYLEYQEMADEF